jgi:hypothetical protein
LLNQVYQRADALLFGRKTYEIFAGSWGAVADPSINPIATALNTMPKYVASTTLTDPRWADTTVLSSEVAAAVGGVTIQVYRPTGRPGVRSFERRIPICSCPSTNGGSSGRRQVRSCQGLPPNVLSSDHWDFVT